MCVRKKKHQSFVYGGTVLKKIFKLILPMAFAVFTAGCSVGNIDRSKVISAPRDYELTILALGDTNGQAEGGLGTGMGYSRFSTILERARKEFGKENVLYLEAGNTFYGSEIAETDKGESIVKILNALGLDAMTLGNNDFNYGERAIKSLELRANFKILAANVKTISDGQNLVVPYILKEVNGTKIGIFGLVSPETYSSPKAVLDNITIEEPILAGNKVVKELKSQGAEFIIALSHLGMNGDTNREWQSTTIAETVPGIDLIIDGNSDEPMEEKLMVNDTVIIQTGENLMNVGVLRIDFDAPRRDTGRIFYKIIKKEDVVMVEDTPAPVVKKEETAAPKFVTHTVVKGDTLYSLARRYGTTVAEIVALNPSIEDGQTISIGQTYVMTSGKKPVESREQAGEYIEHTVVKGDTLYSLARKYGTTVDAVVAVNPEITDGQSIKIGQTYKFPTNLSNSDVSQINTAEENTGDVYGNEESDRIMAESPVPVSNTRVAASSGIEKDPKIENLLAKIKTAQSFMKTK